MKTKRIIIVCVSLCMLLGGCSLSNSESAKFVNDDSGVINIELQSSNSEDIIVEESISIEDSYSPIDTDNNDIEPEKEAVSETIESPIDIEDSLSGYSKLENILHTKSWSENIKKLVLELYNEIDYSFGVREGYDLSEKDNYLENYINTIESINIIEHNPDDEVLKANGWSARADYCENRIVLKFENLSDLRHEIAHLEEGTFLFCSCIGDLGFVLEEGRASYKEGEALSSTEWMDNFNFDVNHLDGQNLTICNTSGSYPAFEDVYKKLISLGIDLESIRRESGTKPVDYVIKDIEDELNVIYGDNLGTDYIMCLNEYIEFFNTHGVVDMVSNENGETASDVKERLDELYDFMLMVKSN